MKIWFDHLFLAPKLNQIYQLSSDLSCDQPLSKSFYFINVQIDFVNPLVSYICSYRMYLFSGSVSTCVPVVSQIRGSESEADGSAESYLLFMKTYRWTLVLVCVCLSVCVCSPY